ARSASRFIRFHPALIVVVGACAVLFRDQVRSGLAGDVFYQLAAGQWMLSHHAVIRHDVFSYTVAGRPWLADEWGFEVLLAWLVNHVGAVSYWLVSAGACVVALLAGVARWRRIGAGWLWVATLSVLAAAGLYLGLNPRPQDLSYMYFSLLLLFLTLARRRTMWLVAVPPLLLIWANTHGSFLLGLGVVALEVVWAALPPLKRRVRVSSPLPLKAAALALVFGFAAILVNPHGFELVTYSYKVSTNNQLNALISEWQTPNFHSLFLLAVIIGPVLFFIGLLAFSDTSFALEDLVIAGILLVSTLHAIRFAPYFAVAVCGLLARWSPIRTETIRPTVVSLPLAVVLAVALLAGPHVPAGAPARGGPLGNPVAATNFLERQTGRVFTTYWWSDYLIYRHIPVFVDGRTDLYFGTDILSTYANVAQLTVNPDNVFRQWDVRWVMWQKATSVTVFLTHDRQWRVAYKAGDAIVFEHVGPW
ncbi:MAG TPA: hypothetical protein VEJ84_15455, partial [Acidimicrobiales bacterium]|nr:hypothetical protein [Acidimicrobiales bacterium]